MVAALSLDKEALNVAFVLAEYRYSERQACKLLDPVRASYRN
jgi:hypothetical protein